MNPLTNMKNVKKLSELELQGKYKTSWHDQYKDSAWIFVGGLPYDLTEGDVICVFSQYGEIVHLNLVRDKATGKSKGFCFICYEDQRSTNLAVDNFNGIKLLTRTIRVDHVNDYKAPKDSKKIDEETRQLQEEGCAPGSKYGHMPKLPSPSAGGLAKAPNGAPPLLLPPLEVLGRDRSEKPLEDVQIKKEKKEKKVKKEKKEKQEKKKQSTKDKIRGLFKKKSVSSGSDDSDSSSDSDSKDENKRKKKQKKSRSSSSDSDSDSKDEKKKRKKIKKTRKSTSDSDSEDERKKRKSLKKSRRTSSDTDSEDERSKRKSQKKSRRKRHSSNSDDATQKKSKSERSDKKMRRD